MTKKTIAIILIVITLFTTAGVLAVVLPKNSGSGGSASLSASTSNNKFDTLNGELNTYITKVQTLETEKKYLQDLYDEKSVLYNQLLSDYNSTTDVLVSTRKELIQLTLDMEDKDAEIERLKSAIEELSIKIQELQKEYDELQEKYTNATLNYDTFEQLLKGELTTLFIPDGVKSLEGGTFIKSKSVTNIYLNEVEYLYGDIFSSLSIVDLDLMNVKSLYSSSSLIGVSNSIYSEKLESVTCELAYSSDCPNIFDFSNNNKLSVYLNYSFSNKTSYHFYSDYIYKMPKMLEFVGTLSGYNPSLHYYDLFISSKYVEFNNILCTTNGQNLNRFGFNITNLENLVLNSESALIPVSIVMGTSVNLSNLKIYVPDELVDEYKATEVWTPYVDCFRPLSEKPEGIDTVEYYENA